MKGSLYLPIDEVTGASADLDRAADFLELSAFFSPDCVAMTSGLANGVSVGSEGNDSESGVESAQDEERLVDDTVQRMNERQRVLDSSYPFRLERGGDVLRFIGMNGSLGRVAYILCLVLSNLKSASAVLADSGLHPDDDEVRELRQYFQYFATAALAAEIGGGAWSFGFPRPDGSSFVGKLEEIWDDICDGKVEPQTGAPKHPKDDKFDVIAARTHRDRLPGFLLAVAQVATGTDAKEKSLRGHLDAFKSRWFAKQPVTAFVPYMVMPFAIQRDQFSDDVRTMGNILHRLRVPLRVAEAGNLVKDGLKIEGYDELKKSLNWLEDYRNRLPS